MLGRGTGRLGNFRATDYIAREVQRLGLEPAGENGTFFQTLPYANINLAPGTSFSIVGDSTLVLGTDYFPIGGKLVATALPVIYGGRAGESVTLPDSVVAGKLILFGPAADSGRRANPNGIWGYALNRPQGAVGILYAALDDFTSSDRSLAGERITFLRDTMVKHRIEEDRYVMILLTAAVAERIFGAPFEQLKPGAIGKPITAAIAYVVGGAIAHPARNVVAVLRGSDPTLRTQYVAVGAHNDHIGMRRVPVADHDSLRVYNRIMLPHGAGSPDRTPTAEEQARINSALAALRATTHASPRPDSIFNGADDDGSGSMAVLEIAEYLASRRAKPKRSILFVWHTGEERGLLGSMWFTDHPTVPRDSIITQLNIDMVGRGAASDLSGGGPRYVQLVGSRRLSTELGDLVESVNRRTPRLRLDYTYDAQNHPEQIYCRSDHYSYARYGIPVTFFTTGGHSDYHELTDEAQYIDYPHYAKVTSFIAAVALEVANRTAPPKVDHPKPDPHGACRQ